MKDFFISYNSADEDDATWIAWQLEETGYTVIIQAWDFKKGNNFVIEMNKASIAAKQTIAILSPNFLASQYTLPEWAAAFAQDPTGTQRKLIPVRVKPVEITSGLLVAINYIDIVGIDRETAKQKLLQGVKGERLKPATEPTPSFHLQPNEKIKAPNNFAIAEYKIGQLNRTTQYKHFKAHIPKECCLQQGKPFGFILAGPEQEWPVAIRFRLAYLLEKVLIGDSKHMPNFVRLNTDLGLANEPVENDNQYLWDLLGDALNCQREQTALQEKLSQLPECHIFFREALQEEINAPNFLANLLSAWKNLQLHPSSKSHFLLFICEIDNPQQSWQEQIASALQQSNIEQALLPQLQSLNYHGDIKDWIKLNIDNDTLRDSISEALAEFAQQADIPLIKLKKILKPLIERYPSH